MAAARLAVVALLASAPACHEEAAAEYGSTEAYPRAGLFTPGNRIGYRPPAAIAGDAGPGYVPWDEQPEQEDRCRFSGMGARPGTLTARFETASYGGHYQPNNCGAVWIEDADGAYVATPLIWAGVYIKNLFTWNTRRCVDDDSVPDALTSATLDTHASHTLQWDGRSHTGESVPDGIYTLRMELTEDEFEYGELAAFEFAWGPEPFIAEPGDSTSFKNVSIEFMPRAATER